VKNFNYFVNEIGLPTGQPYLYYDFNESGANPILSQDPSQSPFNGSISPLGAFYSVPGSGWFNSGQSVSIANASSLNSSNFSAFFVYEKPYTGNSAHH